MYPTKPDNIDIQFDVSLQFGFQKANLQSDISSNMTKICTKI